MGSGSRRRGGGPAGWRVGAGIKFDSFDCRIMWMAWCTQVRSYGGEVWWMTDDGDGW